MAKILVVEDFTTTQRLLSYVLQVGGHAVTPAGNGCEALDELSHGTFDLLIVDIMMPTMDGLTLLRHVRADTRYTSLPVIMLTSSVDDQHKRDAIACGANSFLVKPISSTDLSLAVNTLLAG